MYGGAVGPLGGLFTTLCWSPILRIFRMSSISASGDPSGLIAWRVLLFTRSDRFVSVAFLASSFPQL